MKNYYLLVLSLVAIFSFNQLNAQNCPPTGFSDGTSLYFFYNPGTSLCGDRPNSVTVESFTFTLTSCDDEYSIYDISTTDTLADANNFVADFGFGTCEYSNGSLTSENLLSISDKDFLENSIRVFPNPVSRNNDVFVLFGKNFDAQIKMFSVTGKLVYNNSVSNISRTKINTEALNNGVYLLQVNIDNATVTRKVIVMN